MRAFVFAVLGLALPSLVYAAIPLGPAHPLTSPAAVIADGSQRDVRITTNGQETLVAWIDSTPGRRGAYIAAVGDQGLRVPGTQKLIAADADWIELTWNGSAYLAFWSNAGSRVKVTTLDTQHHASEARIVSRESTRFTSSIAWLGQRGAVMQGRFLTILDRDGDVIEDLIDPAPGGIVKSDVATDGESFFVFWQRQVTQPDNSTTTEIYTRRFDTEGVPRDAAPVLVAQTPRLAEEWDVSFGGNRFAIITAEPHGGGEATLRPFLFDPATMQPTALAISTMFMVSEPRVEWVGDRFVAMWFRNDDDAGVSTLLTTTITPDGAMSAPLSRTAVSHVGRESRDVWNGRVLIVAFAVLGFDSGDVLATAVNWNEVTPHSRTPVALSPEWQAMPSIATNGVESLVVWTEGYIAPWARGASSVLRVKAAHMTNGIVDTPPLHLGLTFAASAINQRGVRPSVVFTGSMYLVLWTLYDRDVIVPQVMLQRISTRGELLDDAPIALAQGYTTALAWNGTHALAAWGAEFGVFAARLTRDGAPFDATPVQLTTDLADDALVAASNGSEFLVAWSYGYSSLGGSENRSDIHAALVSAAGLRIAGPIPVAVGIAEQNQPVVASDRRDFLIAYVEEGQSLMTKKVLREGTLDGTASAPGRVVAGTTRPIAPTLAANTNGYYLAWENTSNVGTAELLLAGLDRNGAVNDAPSLVASSPVSGMWSMLATTGSQRGDFVFGVPQESGDYGAVLRLFSRRIGTSQPRGRASRH